MLTRYNQTDIILHYGVNDNVEIIIGYDSSEDSSKVFYWSEKNNGSASIFFFDGLIQQFRLIDNHLYFIAPFQGLFSAEWNATTAEFSVPKKLISLSSLVVDFTIRNTTAYILDLDYGLLIVDLVGDTKANLVNVVLIPGNLSQIVTQGDFIFISNETAIFCFNGSNPLNPTLIDVYRAADRVVEMMPLANQIVVGGSTMNRSWVKLLAIENASFIEQKLLNLPSDLAQDALLYSLILVPAGKSANTTHILAGFDQAPYFCYWTYSEGVLKNDQAAILSLEGEGTDQLFEYFSNQPEIQSPGRLFAGMGEFLLVTYTDANWAIPIKNDNTASDPNALQYVEYISFQTPPNMLYYYIAFICWSIAFLLHEKYYSGYSSMRWYKPNKYRMIEHLVESVTNPRDDLEGMMTHFHQRLELVLENSPPFLHTRDISPYYSETEFTTHWILGKTFILIGLLGVFGYWYKTNWEDWFFSLVVLFLFFYSISKVFFNNFHFFPLFAGGCLGLLDYSEIIFDTPLFSLAILPGLSFIILGPLLHYFIPRSNQKSVVAGYVIIFLTLLWLTDTLWASENPYLFGHFLIGCLIGFLTMIWLEVYLYQTFIESKFNYRSSQFLYGLIYQFSMVYGIDFQKIQQKLRNSKKVNQKQMEYLVVFYLYQRLKDHFAQSQNDRIYDEFPSTLEPTVEPAAIIAFNFTHFYDRCQPLYELVSRIDVLPFLTQENVYYWCVIRPILEKQCDRYREALTLIKEKTMDWNLKDFIRGILDHQSVQYIEGTTERIVL